MLMMKDAYYPNLIQALKKLVENQQYEEANRQIEEELRMPYVPKEPLKELQELKAHLKAFLGQEPVLIESDEGILESYLYASESLQLKLLDSLSQLNARKYLSLIQKALTEFKDPLMKALLIRILIEQALPDSFYVVMNDIHYTFIPASLMLPEESEGYREAVKHLNRWCEKEPSLLELCQASLSLNTLLRLPSSFDEEEGQALALTSLKEVYVSLYSEAEFETFCREQKIESTSLALLN